MIELREDARSLVVTVGGDPDYEFRFAPITAPEGANLLFLMMGSIAGTAAADLSDDAVNQASDAMSLVLADHHERITTELRDAEVTEIFQAVMFWQIKGGNFELAKLSTSDPKAAWEAWAAAVSPLMKLGSSNGAAPATSTDAGDTAQNS